MVRKKVTHIKSFEILQSVLEERGYSVSLKDGELNARKFPYHFIFEKNTKKECIFVRSHIDFKRPAGSHAVSRYQKGTENKLRKEYRAIIKLYFRKANL
jgi:hypothetical protein